MRNPFRDITARVLVFANSMISDKGRLNLPVLWRMKHLDYAVPKAQMERIFKTRSGQYADEIHTTGIEIRELAGYGAASVQDAGHGYGNTRVMRNGIRMNVYITDIKRGVGFSGKRIVETLGALFSNLPLVIVHAKKPTAMIGKALGETPRKCEQAIVARTPVLNADPKRVVFTIKAEYIAAGKDENVILKEIFMPVVNAHGNVTGTERIDPKDPDADIQTLRALIFFKLFMDGMADGQPADAAACLEAVRALPLDKTSKLRDYLTYQAQPAPKAA